MRMMKRNIQMRRRMMNKVQKDVERSQQKAKMTMYAPL